MFKKLVLLSSPLLLVVLLSPQMAFASTIKIASTNRTRLIILSELSKLGVIPACYLIRGRIVPGIIEHGYFKSPLTKLVYNRSKDFSSDAKSELLHALRRAQNQCRHNVVIRGLSLRRLRRQPTPTPTKTKTKTPSPTKTPTRTPTRTATITPTMSATPTATYTPTPTPSPTSSAISVVVPLRSEWEAQMLSYGKIHCQNLKDPTLSFDQHLAATYYDAQWVFYQIGDYTGDSYWYDCAGSAEASYRDTYLIPNNGNVPGYWNFSHGLTRDFLSTGDSTSRSATILLSENAAYAPDTTPLSWTLDATMSREVAYAIMTYLNAEQIGQAHRTRTEQFVAQALGHIDQWFISHSAEYVRPFMFSLTAHALISYDAQIGGNAQILPAITQGANWIWDNCWLPAEQAFKYTDRPVPSGGTEPAPDLNLLIAPVYAWLWHQTGDPVYRDRADEIFAGGVRSAWLSNGKQFNQNYRWSFDYIKWRTIVPLR